MHASEVSYADTGAVLQRSLHSKERMMHMNSMRGASRARIDCKETGAMTGLDHFGPSHHGRGQACRNAVKSHSIKDIPCRTCAARRVRSNRLMLGGHGNVLLCRLAQSNFRIRHIVSHPQPQALSGIVTFILNTFLNT